MENYITEEKYVEYTYVNHQDNFTRFILMLLLLLLILSLAMHLLAICTELLFPKEEI